MQQRCFSPTADNSDNDQGFIVNPIEIKHKETPRVIVSSTSKPIDYQPRYINGPSLIRKQLPQLTNTYPHFTKEEHPAYNRISRKKQRQVYQKIEQQSFPNKNYQLVYQRFNKNSDFEAITTQNNVSLASVVGYSADNYSILKNWQLNKNNNEDLIFQSRFQCGNLFSAYKSLNKPNHYVLFIQNDTNTKGYNKWFYFAVKNKLKNQVYTFSIVNFRKGFDYIKQGMKITRFSLKQYVTNGIGWSKSGSNMHMYHSKLQNLNQNNYKQYTLTFQINFEYENDVNFFSLLPPYSYSKLINFLVESKKSCSQRQDLCFQYQTISYSLSNTQVPYVVVSGKEKSKKNIVVLARQHPGEVWSSFFAQSLMRELFRDSFPEKQWLLKQFTFRIFPMINVDGVIYGNFRCDLAGMDLNRCWKEPNKLLHPHLCAIKQQIMRISRQEQVVCCFDLHAHSKQHNIFAYCCKTDSQGRILPLLISRMSNLFYFPSCTFGVSKYKETTARAVIYDITKAPDVLTIQSSFFAANNPFKVITPSSYITFSNAVLKALKYYYYKGKEYLEAEEALPKAMAQFSLIRAKNKNKYELQEESGSDSQPDCDEIALTEKLGKILPKCTAVEVALGLVNEQKKKTDNMPKIDNPKNKEKQISNKRSKASYPKNTISYQPLSTINKVEKTPLIITKPALKNNNTVKNEVKKQMSTVQKKNEPREEIDRNIKYTFQASHNNQSLEMPARKTSNLSKFLANEFHSTFRQKQIPKYQMSFKYQRKEQEELPLLCVLSERKKQAHLQKIKRIHPPQPHKEKPIVRYQPTLVINKKLDTMQKLRERQKHSSDLVAAVWKQALGYDQDGPIKHIFYG